MKNFLKISLICVFLLIITSVVSFAVDIDMNITNDNIEDDFINDINEDIKSIEHVENGEDRTFSSNPTLSTYVEDDEPVYKISTSTTSEDSQLTASDIIDIILISVGVVIILLAIAIIIRLKK